MRIDERATYSYRKVNECIEAVKKVPVTTRAKNSHFAAASNLKDVCDFCYEKTGCLLFDFEHTPVQDYFRAAYDFKNHTGNELNSLKRRAVMYLQNEILGIKQIMDNGEVNAEW